jgi:hypothetical protein
VTISGKNYGEIMCIYNKRIHAASKRRSSKILICFCCTQHAAARTAATLPSICSLQYRHRPGPALDVTRRRPCYSTRSIIHSPADELRCHELPMKLRSCGRTANYSLCYSQNYSLDWCRAEKCFTFIILPLKV